MRIYENFTSDNYIDDDIPAVCIGGFDGVHLEGVRNLTIGLGELFGEIYPAQTAQ